MTINGLSWICFIFHLTTAVPSQNTRKYHEHICANFLDQEKEIDRTWSRQSHSLTAEQVQRLENQLNFGSRRCPYFDEYFSGSDDMKSKSISPSGPIVDFDPKRHPRVIIHQACLCQHCFDLATMALDHNLASHNMTASITVRKNGRKMKYAVITGCTCIIPSTMAL